MAILPASSQAGYGFDALPNNQLNLPITRLTASGGTVDDQDLLEPELLQNRKVSCGWPTTVPCSAPTPQPAKLPKLAVDKAGSGPSAEEWGCHTLLSGQRLQLTAAGWAHDVSGRRRTSIDARDDFP
jgi:hypothetical protein